MALWKIGVSGFFKSKLAIKTARHFLKLALNEKVEVVVSSEFPVSRDFKQLDLKDFDVDLLFIFGGDGSILHVFRELGEKQLPVMGVNCGELGYFMDLDSKNFASKLPLILQGNFVVERRNRLEGSVDGAKLPFALNEYVITATKSATLMRYNLNIDNNFLWKDSADGVIVASPTGSTAYSLSSGGPISLFDTNVLLINPINSMAHTNRLVVNENSAIKIFNINASSSCELVCDGQERFKVKDEVLIRKSAYPALLARMQDSRFNFFKKKTYLAESSLEEKLKNSSPSAKFIFKVLELENSLTQKEIINITKLPVRTVRRALEDLLKREIIAKRPFISDPRQDLYILNR